MLYRAENCLIHPGRVVDIEMIGDAVEIHNRSEPFIHGFGSPIMLIMVFNFLNPDS
jgi:hypothetical protein